MTPTVTHTTIELQRLRVEHPPGVHNNHWLSFALFDTGLSITVCREILNGDAYPLLPDDVLSPDSVKTIYDIGANVGASCLYWCDNYLNAKVYAYEPGRDAYDLLCQNTAKLHVEPYNIALGASDGFVNLYHNVEDPCCNSLIQHKSHGHEVIVVERARTHISTDIPIDILKLDTEGSELEILADIEAWIPDIKVIYVEYHSDHDRHYIDRLTQNTHALWSSHATRPHRGELCYVRKDIIPDKYNNWAIQ